MQSISIGPFLAMAYFAAAAPTVTPEVINLYDKANMSMSSTMKAHGNIGQDGKPVNALVIFHLDNCVFCEMTLGTILYNFKNENIFGLTGIQPYQVLVDGEGKKVPGHVYCKDDASCTQQAKETLDVDVTALTSFPTAYFYDSAGKVTAQVGDTPCGIAVRRDADSRCTSRDITHCSLASNDMDNWVCNLHKKPAAPTDCKTGSSSAWQRCKSSGIVPSIIV